MLRARLLRQGQRRRAIASGHKTPASAPAPTHGFTINIDQNALSARQ